MFSGSGSASHIFLCCSFGITVYIEAIHLSKRLETISMGGPDLGKYDINIRKRDVKATIDDLGSKLMDEILNPKKAPTHSGSGKRLEMII